MAQMSDLPNELMIEILSRVPLTSLRDIRSTCKTWNVLSKNLILRPIEKQFLSFMMMDSKLCSLQFDLQGIHNNDEEEVYPLIKQVALFEEIEISKVFHCDGLLLCVINDNKSLLVWNPYLCETKWILTTTNFDDNSDRFALGYDKNRNHKILRLCSSGYEIYDLCSDSWSVHYLPPEWDDWEIVSHQGGVSLKGNTYFMFRKKFRPGERPMVMEHILLLCFDYTSERFGQPLPMPFRAYLIEHVTLSCVGEDKLSMLHRYKNYENLGASELDIWVTNKLDDDDPKETIMWSKFLKSFSFYFVRDDAGSFFIDEEKEVAVVFDLDKSPFVLENCIRYQTAHIIGQDGFYKPVNFGEAPNLLAPLGYVVQTQYCLPYVCSSYVPSLVQLQKNTKTRKRKERYE